MGMSKNLGITDQVPIYEAMYKSGVVDKKVFNICLGKNGGWM
jgi:hypothetical protein